MAGGSTWASTSSRVTTLQIDYRRPRLYPKQKAAIFHTKRYGVIEASTKSGKTAGCIAWFVEKGLAGRDGQNFWWIAPVFPQAKIAFRRIKRALRPQTAFEPNEGELTITLLNGAILWFKSADKPDSLYGEDVYAAVIDEATRCKEEAWHAIRSTLTATRGPVRIIGNVKGRKNWAYRLARKAESGERDMHYAKLTAYDAVQAGVLAKYEVEDARQKLPEAVFRELYLAEPSDDAGNPFGLKAIHACIAPMSTKPPAVWGWDIAGHGADWTVGIGLDRTGTTCGFHRFQGPFELSLTKIRGAVNGTRAIVDETGMGSPVVEALQKHGSNFLGFTFTQQSKQYLMETLALAIQQQTVHYPEGEITSELESFEYEYTRTGVRYTAPEGLYDDCVCALALAVHGRQQHQMPEVEASMLSLTGPSYWRG